MVNAEFDDVKHSHYGDKVEYRLYVALAYPLFLVGTIIGRLTSLGRVQRIHASRRRLSVFSEAAEGVRSTIPWVFSGR